MDSKPAHISNRTPLLDRIDTPADLRRFPESDLQADRRRAARRADRRGVADRRAFRGGSRRRRADRRAALRLRHAARPADLGCRPSGLSAQDPDRTARPHPHDPAGRRPVRVHQAVGERIRPVRRGAQLDLDLGRARHGGGARLQGREARRDRGDRRRGDERRHGLRGDEQCRIDGCAADRHPQRQRHVDRAAGRRIERASVARPDLAPVPVVAPYRRRSGEAPAEAPGNRRAPRRGAGAQLRDRRHAVRGTRLLLCRPDRRAQYRPSACRY